jgi:hypothetical protein
VKMRFQKYSHRFAEEILNSKFQLKSEIEFVLQSVHPISAREDRKTLHKTIIKQFKDKGWKTEETITYAPVVMEQMSITGPPKTLMRFDLLKEKVAIEVQTSHVVHCYKDFLKFLVGFNDQAIDVGVEIVYADHAKSLGGGSLPTLGKVSRELERMFYTVIPVPIFGIGLEP